MDTTIPSVETETPTPRNRQHTQDEALRRVNEARRPKPGHVSVNVYMHLPASVAEALRDLDVRERGEVVIAGLAARADN